MTEEQWMACTTNPAVMLDQFRDQTSNRKSRLMAVTCCRRLLPMVAESERGLFTAALALAERVAEGELPTDELAQPYLDSQVGPSIWELVIACHSLNPEACWAARKAVVAVARYVGYHSVEGRPARREELRVQTDIVRCVLGNPFRPVSLDLAWLSSDVVALARGIYEERAFDRMPILADALQDAGCDNEDMLSHCRDASVMHARGCWVVDLVLGKE